MNRMHALLSLALVTTAGCNPYWQELRDTGDPDPLVDTAPDTGDEPDSATIECFEVKDNPAFADSGTVFGRVMSPSGEIPVLSAIVEIVIDGEAAWMLTNCDGAFSLDLPPGQHQLGVTKGRYTAGRQIEVFAGQPLDLGDVTLDVADVKIGVISGQYDDIGALITKAGLPMEVYGRPSDLLTDPAKMAELDLIFSNCGSLATTTSVAHYSPEEVANTRAWLEAGGTLYTSDWEYELFDAVVPEGLNFNSNPKLGAVSAIEADVLDRDIQTMLGKATAELRFNLNDWVVIDSAEYAYVLAEGRVDGTGRTHPMAALMPVGSGKAIFTSFHNESQITDDMEIILYDMILGL